MRRLHGFTLIEVLVALAIVAFGLTALFTVTNQTARASTYLREKTLAQWIALNRITEARLAGQPPADDNMEGETKYAGQDWRWELKTIKTPVSGIVRLDAILLGDMRHFLDLHVQDEHAFVQHLVVLKVVQQRRRHDIG